MSGTGRMPPPAQDQKRRDRAAAAAARLADRDTPLIRNAWYAAARSDEIGRKLFARQYAGISVVLFRREDGAPVALQNRCGHRSFPLSEGRLHGDVLRRLDRPIRAPLRPALVARDCAVASPARQTLLPV